MPLFIKEFINISWLFRKMFKVKYIIQAINGYNYLQTCMDKKGMVPQLKTRIYFSIDSWVHSWIPDSTHWIPVFVCGTWDPDSNR